MVSEDQRCQVMSRFHRETDDCHIERKHCRTCVCHNEDAVRRPASPRTRYTSVRHQDLSRKCRRSPVDDWKEREHYHEKAFRNRYRVSSATKIERKPQSDNKFAMLENWFKEFDFDGNGLIDVYELQRLLHYLGVQCDQDYVKDLIEDSDRDHDGMLSFSEFLCMWSHAANEDFEALADVIKEHDLHPDILPSAKHHTTQFNSRSLHVKEVRKHEPHREYPCCEYVPKRKPYGRNNVKVRELQITSKVKRSPSQCSDDMPLFSCHR